MTYRYVGITFGYGGSGSSAWQTLKAKRAAMGASLGAAQANLAAITSAFASAQQDKLTGLGTLAANAAIARIKADAQTKKDALLNQIDGAQSTLDAAKAVSMGKPKFVSWALTQTVDTTA